MCGHAGAFQIVLDLALHGSGLPGDQGTSRAAERAAFVDEHGKRRLQRMGEIADLGPRTLDDAPVVLDQRVGLGGERFDLRWKTALEPLRLSFADQRERRPHPGQRLQSEHDRECVDQDHAGAEQKEIDRQLPLEGGDLLLQLRSVTHHPEPRNTVLGIEHILALDHAQHLAGRSVRDIGALEIGLERHLAHRRRGHRAGHVG